MQVTVESTANLERRLTITVPAEKVEYEVEKKLRHMISTIKLDGFRPGKVPPAEIRRRYGNKVRDEVIKDVIQNALAEAIKQEHLTPAGIQAIELKSADVGVPLEYQVILEIFPEINLLGLQGIEIWKYKVEIGELDIVQAIDKLRYQTAEWEASLQAAVQGDRLRINYKMVIEKQEGEQSYPEKEMSLILGSGSMIPGFEESLLGITVPETRPISLTFPKNYHDKSLAGKDAFFTITALEIEKAKLPEVDEEFIQKVGIKRGDISQLHAKVKASLEQDANYRVAALLREQVFDYLLKANHFDIPRSLVKQEIQYLQKAVSEQGGNSPQEKQTILEGLSRASLEAQGQKNVKLGLLMAEFVKHYNVSQDAEKVKKHIKNIAESYDDPEQVIHYYYHNEQLLRQVEQLVLEEIVIGKLLEGATVKEVSISYQALKENNLPHTQVEGN